MKLKDYIISINDILDKDLCKNIISSSEDLTFNKAGTTGQLVRILNVHIADGETFVWNDKFSFNGHEPTDFTGPIDSLAKQDAIADQGSSVAQLLTWEASQAADSFEVTVTFIDQNNA